MSTVETTETTETQPKKDMADVAAESQVFRRKELHEGDLNFVEDLDELDAALEADNIVCRFNNPNGEKPIDFEMRPMTPGEMAIYYNTLFGHTFLEATDGDLNPDAVDEGAVDEDAVIEIDDSYTQRLEEELAVKKYDARLLNILEGCILFPIGVTAERMRKWLPFYITKLHNALLEGSRPSKSVAQFPDVDKGS